MRNNQIVSPFFDYCGWRSLFLFSQRKTVSYNITTGSTGKYCLKTEGVEITSCEILPARSERSNCENSFWTAVN
jgi:hypothetical protein